MFSLQISNFPTGFQATQFPSPLGLAAGHTLSSTRKVGEAVSNELYSVGINWILAPVVGILTDETEPLDASRRFSDQVGIIRDHAQAFIQGLHVKGIVSCATETLSSTIHEIYNLINGEGPEVDFVKSLEPAEIEPLKYLLEQDCLDSLQISSTVHEFQDPVRLGHSINAATQVILRERLNCQSPITLDCSALPPDSNACIKHAPLRALLAGCDMVRLPNDGNMQVACISAIYAALATSHLESIASAAVSRVSKLKDSCISWGSVFSARADLTVPFTENANTAQSAYRASITALAAESSPLLDFPSTSMLLLLTPTVYSIVNPDTSSTSDPFEPLGRALSRSHSRIRHVPYTVSAGLTSTHMAFLNRASAVVLVLCNSSSAFVEAQEEFVDSVRRVVYRLDSIEGANIRKIAIAAGDPRDMKGNWGGWWRVCCYEYTSKALEAVAEVVVGQKQATGLLPISLK